MPNDDQSQPDISPQLEKSNVKDISESANLSNRYDTIVIVDDEEIILTSLKSFLTLNTNYNVKTFTSVNNALNFIKNNNIDLIISDYTMPEMDGITFLDKVKLLQPEIPRILITANANKQNAIKAINDIGIFQYIEKPWDNNDILIVIRNGLEKRQLTRKLREKIDEMNRAYSELQNLHREIIKTFV